MNELVIGDKNRNMLEVDVLSGLKHLLNGVKFFDLSALLQSLEVADRSNHIDFELGPFKTHTQWVATTKGEFSKGIDWGDSQSAAGELATLDQHQLLSQLEALPEQTNCKHEQGEFLAIELAKIGGVDPLKRDDRITKRGYYFGPAIVTDVSPEHSLATQELFGPLVCVFRFKAFEEAIQLANNVDYALTGGVYTRSPLHVEQAIAHFDVGNLYINRKITGAMVGRQPFGGHKLSGLGTKAGSADYLLQMLQAKTIASSTARHGMPLE